MKTLRFCFALLACLLCASRATGQPAALPSVNPLDRALASLEAGLVPADDQAPEQKIVPRLWSRLAKTGEEASIPLIIELYQPAHPRSEAAGSEAWDAEQADLSAAIEQQFEAKTKDLVTDLRGLSHFPILFGTAKKADLLRIAALPEVFRVYEDEPVHTTRTEGAALIKADVLRTSFGGNGSGIGVAIVDTGISPHSELASRIVAQGDYTGTTGNGTIDDNGHGTAVAGIVAGTTGGMARQANLWAVKALKADGSGLTSGILSGLNAIYASRAMFGGLHVVNMSLGGGGPFNSDCDAVSAYNSILNSFFASGIAVLVSSGNDGFGSGVSDPSCHSKVLSVGAVYDANLGTAAFSNCTDQTTAADQIPCYSNSGNPLDILAPSHCARTPAPGGGYNTCFGGTSAAAPYAAGVAAQLLSLRPGTSPTALRNALMTTGRARTDVNGITRNRIDAVAALQALGGGSGPCVRDAETACLLNNRFEVKVDWQTATASGKGQIMSFGGQRAENSESAFYWFFGPTNFEMGLKMLNACAPPFNKFWVFISGLTNQGWTVHIRDTQTGATKTYSNPVGQLTPTTADTSALSCP